MIASYCNKDLIINRIFKIYSLMIVIYLTIFCEMITTVDNLYVSLNSFLN